MSGMALQPRYIVTEIEGWNDTGRHSPRQRPGMSVQVLDRLTCYRIVRQWRTEDNGPATDRARDYLRHEAATLAARLNGEPPPEPFNRWRSRFRPTCPHCGAKAEPTDAYCRSCKANLYRHEWNGHGAARHE